MGKRHRIAFFSKSKSRTMYTTYVIRALRRIGCDVRHINMGTIRRYVGRSLADKLVRSYLDRFEPDAIIVFSADIQDETFDYFCGRVKTGLLLDDTFPIDSPVIRFIRRVDVFFLTMTGQLEAYRAAGAKRAVFLHNGVDPDHHRRSTPHRSFASDVAFIGGAHYPDRIDLIKTLHDEFDLKVYGPGWQKFGIQPARHRIGVKQFSRVCASTKIIVGIDISADLELCFSNRTWFVLGCGGFLITRYVPGLELLFANHKHMVWYRDKEEAGDQVRFYLRHDALRERIASTAYEFVHTHYPFDRMASNMVDVLFHGREPQPLTDPGPSLDRGALARMLPGNGGREAGNVDTTSMIISEKAPQER